MYFLSQALAGMRRRLFSSILMLCATVAILLSGAAVSLWAYWLAVEQGHARAERQASVFVDSTDVEVVSAAISKIRTLPGVEAVQQIAVQEFMGYLERRFPDIADAMRGMAADAFPSMIEVTLLRDADLDERRATLAGLRVVPGVSRVDQGAKQVGEARASLAWLGRGALALAIGLWVVLVVVSLGHFQALFHKEAAMIQLLRGFGADPVRAYFPWAIEAGLQALGATVIALAAMAAGQSYLAAAFNEFFEALGYEPFTLGADLLLTCGAGMFLACVAAQAVGGALAVIRGKLA